jgi:predicted MPP superfamily phosphohydrolase
VRRFRVSDWSKKDIIVNLLILHLSDIHIRNGQDVVLKRGEAIGRATFKDLSLADAVTVLITGDIAFSGKTEQYRAAKKFIDQIVDTIRSERDIPIDVLMCPGNHDCDFDDGNQDVRDIVIEKVRTTPPDEIKESLVVTCTAVQDNFFWLRDQFKTRGAGANDKLWFTKSRSATTLWRSIA